MWKTLSNPTKGVRGTGKNGKGTAEFFNIVTDIVVPIDQVKWAGRNIYKGIGLDLKFL